MDHTPIVDALRPNQVPVKHQIWWKRRPGIYEPGATGPKWCPLPPERWSAFRTYPTAARRDASFKKLVETRTDAEWRRVDA